MKVNWEVEKETVEKLIKNGIAYEQIGRQYGVSGVAVKKAAKKLGIKLEERRKINPNEHFNKGKNICPNKFCLNCNKEIKYRGGFYLYKFCSNKCQGEYKSKKIIESWKKGEYDISPEYLPTAIKKYLLEKHDYKCELCGFEGYNILTKKTILQIHHKDGDSRNNSEENLQVLCPNCHAMTDNYSNCGNRNSSRKRYDSKKYYYDKFKKEYGIV